MMRRISILFFLLETAALFAQPIADGKEKFLGNIISSSNVPSTFDTYWNQVTPENAGKWGSVESTRDNMNWTYLDMAYTHAREKGYPFKEHTLVWGSQEPGWISSLSTADQALEVEQWIALFADRYPDADMIDVVNEPINTPPSYKEALGGSGSTGWDWVIWVFEKAREYCPDSKLILNEYNVINTTSNTNKVIEIVNLLKERNLIDAVGVQCHYFETRYSSAATLKSNLDKLATTGLPIYISEFDIYEADDSTQLAAYKKYFPTLWEHSAVQGVTLWGYLYGKMWQADAYLLNSRGKERPAMVWLREYVQNDNSAVRSDAAVAHDFHLGQNYPNPFNPSTEIVFEVERAAQLDLSVFDLLGHQVQTLKHGYFQPGSYRTVFDASRLPSGVYTYRLTTPDRCLTRKCVFVR